MCDRARRERHGKEGGSISFAVCLHAICSRLLIAVANAVANCELQLQLAMLPGLATRGLGVNHVEPCPYPTPSPLSPITHCSPDRAEDSTLLVSLAVCSHYKCFTCHRLTALQLHSPQTAVAFASCGRGAWPVIARKATIRGYAFLHSV